MLKLPDVLESLELLDAEVVDGIFLLLLLLIAELKAELRLDDLLLKAHEFHCLLLRHGMTAVAQEQHRGFIDLEHRALNVGSRTSIAVADSVHG